jgi:hypothetical protein
VFPAVDATGIPNVPIDNGLRRRLISESGQPIWRARGTAARINNKIRRYEFRWSARGSGLDMNSGNPARIVSRVQFDGCRILQKFNI